MIAVVGDDWSLQSNLWFEVKKEWPGLKSGGVDCCDRSSQSRPRPQILVVSMPRLIGLGTRSTDI